jgi:hypothetical protein
MIRTLRVRGEAKLNRTLGFSGNSTNSAHASQSLGVPAPLALLCNSIFLNARVFFSVWKSGREGRASSKEEASGIQKKKKKKKEKGLRPLLSVFAVLG